MSCPYSVVSLSVSLLLSLCLFLHPIAFLLGEFTHFGLNKMECFLVSGFGSAFCFIILYAGFLQCIVWYL